MTNSRVQKRLNQVWRRRKCLQCHSIFTTHELVSYDNALMFNDGSAKLLPFERDKLFVSLYKSCAHRSTAQCDATALTDTILAKLRGMHTQGVLERYQVITIALDALQHFDNAAAVQYNAYHPI